jgi:hypothetical protein
VTHVSFFSVGAAVQFVAIASVAHVSGPTVLVFVVDKELCGGRRPCSVAHELDRSVGEHPRNE